MGDKLAIKMLEIRADIPIILCTGFSDRISEKQALAKGIKAFVMKPLDMQEIAEVVRNILDGPTRMN